MCLKASSDENKFLSWIQLLVTDLENLFEFKKYFSNFFVDDGIVRREGKKEALISPFGK